MEKLRYVVPIRRADAHNLARKLNTYNSVLLNGWCIIELSLNTQTRLSYVMSVQTLHFTSNVTVELIRRELEQRFPDANFEISIEVPRPPFELTQLVSAVIVRWNDGPDRDLVEDVVAPYQSLDWDPLSGVLQAMEHMEINANGELQQINYGVDYVLCDGPST